MELASRYADRWTRGRPAADVAPDSSAGRASARRAIGRIASAHPARSAAGCIQPARDRNVPPTVALPGSPNAVTDLALSIYSRSPIWMQNLACALAGWQRSRLRYGG